jgi:hypothetical protein
VAQDGCAHGGRDMAVVGRLEPSESGRWSRHKSYQQRIEAATWRRVGLGATGGGARGCKTSLEFHRRFNCCGGAEGVDEDVSSMVVVCRQASLATAGRAPRSQNDGIKGWASGRPPELAPMFSPGVHDKRVPSAVSVRHGSPSPSRQVKCIIMGGGQDLRKPEARLHDGEEHG